MEQLNFEFCGFLFSEFYGKLVPPHSFIANGYSLTCPSFHKENHPTKLWRSVHENVNSFSAILMLTKLLETCVVC